MTSWVSSFRLRLTASGGKSPPGFSSAVKPLSPKMHEVNSAYGETLGSGQPHPVTPPELSSLNPLAMLYGRQFMLHIMRGPSRLTPAQREMIATVTSLASHCRY